MDRPPRGRTEGVITRGMLPVPGDCSGVTSAAPGHLWVPVTVLLAGWHPAMPPVRYAPGTITYRQATTVAWLGNRRLPGRHRARGPHRPRVAAPLGVFTNKPLLAAIAVALAFAALVVYLPAMHRFFGTAALSGGQLATVAPFPFIVWGADEIRRWFIRHRSRT